MNLHRRLRVRGWLWLFISLPLFILAWSLPLPPEAKGADHMRFWDFWLMLLRGDYFCSTEEMVLHLGIYSAIFAVPSLLAGWIMQYLVGIAWEDLARRAGRRSSLSP